MAFRNEKVASRGGEPLRQLAGCPRVYDAAAVTAKGGRDHMEDFAHVEHGFAGQDDRLYAGVFDGHGGDAVSRRASHELHLLLAAELRGGDTLEAALPRAFRAFDEAVAAESCGSTAAVLILMGRLVTVANAGDSHIVLVSRGGAETLTEDHRLTNEAEYRRVVAAGARIWGPYACLPDGTGLMCTRALGDRGFRGIGIISEPRVASRKVSSGDEWIVAGTDGVWDGLDPEAVARLALAAATAGQAAERIRDAALAANTDNVGVVAIRLQ